MSPLSFAAGVVALVANALLVVVALREPPPASGAGALALASRSGGEVSTC